MIWVSHILNMMESSDKITFKGALYRNIQQFLECVEFIGNNKYESILTHWGRVTHICVGKLTIIGSDNGLSPGRRQAIIWNNAGLLLIQPLGTNVSEISIGIQPFSFKKMHLNMSAKWRPFCLGLNVLMKYLQSCKTASLITSQWRHMAPQILVNNGSDNDLLPDGTKPLPELMLIGNR